MGSQWHQRKLVTPPCSSVCSLIFPSLSLPSSQWPLSSPFLTGRGVQLLTYKIWSLSTCVERHEWWWWWDLHTINDLEKGKSVLGRVRERERRKWLVNGSCVDVFQMSMCHFRTKEKVHEWKGRKKLPCWTDLVCVSVGWHGFWTFTQEWGRKESRCWRA